MIGMGLVIGRPALQRFWERVHLLSLRGMGIGTGDFLAGSGERRALAHVARRVPGNAPVTVLDVGANVGEYAASALDVLGPRAQIVSFEPSPAAFARLSERHGANPQVRLVNTALGDAEGTATLYGDAAGSPLGSLYERHLAHHGIEVAPTEEVQVTTLDAWCTREGVTRIDLLKLDAEGHELRILEGGRGLLDAGAIGAIQFEFGGTSIDARTYLRDYVELLGDRYVLHRILPHGLAPTGPYRETLEIFTTTNFLAVGRTS